MKTMKCDICDTDLQGEDFNDWFQASHKHYMADHADVMKEMERKPKEEGEKWMAEAKIRFEAA